MPEKPTSEHHPSPRHRSGWLACLLLLTLVWPAAASARNPAPTQAGIEIQTVAQDTWADLLQRLWHYWWNGADDSQPTTENVSSSSLASGSSDPDGIDPESGDAATIGSDPLNPEPDPPGEPVDERGSVIDPNGAVPP